MSAYASAVPGTDQVLQANTLAKRAYEQSLAQINYGRQSLLRQKGFTGTIDPTSGEVGGVKTDAYNPYGEFQMLNRSQAQRGDQAAYGAQERGLGTGGGLAAQNQNEARFAFGQEDAQLGTSLAEGLAGFSGQQQGAHQEYNSSLWRLQQAASQSAIQNKQWNPADYTDIQYPEYGDDNPPPGVPTVTGGVPGKPRAGKMPTKATLANKYGWGAAATWAKAQSGKPLASKPKPLMPRRLPPGQAKMAAAAKKKR